MTILDWDNYNGTKQTAQLTEGVKEKGTRERDMNGLSS